MSYVQEEESSDKSRERRKQVLDAAAQCFRKYGFHGCSIARISKAAGMSPGHIYYHFANKEAIVEALVSQQKNMLDDLMEKLKSAQTHDGFIATLIEYTPIMIERHTSPDFVGLSLEVASEAARNPSVGHLLKDSDRSIKAQFVELLVKKGQLTTPEQLRQLHIGLEMIIIIFNGLSLRTTTRGDDDNINNSLLVDTINDIVRRLFLHTDPAAKR